MTPFVLNWLNVEKRYFTLKNLRKRNLAVNVFGGAFLAFGMYHVHSMAAVTEGGQLGLILLLQHWFRISPALSSLVINIICYAIGWKTLGFSFIVYSAAAALGFSGSFWICEQFPLLWPELASHPLAAALLGAVFVGIGTGICVRAGGAPSGDDGVVMSISRLTGIKIEYVYIFFDYAVLALSLTYIPLNRILYSVLTASLSSYIIGIIQRAGKKKERSHEKESP